MRPHVDWSLTEVLDDGSALERTDVVQPALFAVMVSLAAWWRSVGVEPDAVVGTSQGEIAAACVTGALSLEDAIRLSALRSRSLLGLEGMGEMALVELGAGEVERRLTGEVWVAGTLSAHATTVSGVPADLGALLQRLEREGVFARRIRTNCATHCPQVELLREEIATVASVRPVNGRVPMLSTVTGDWLGGPELDAGYWYRNLREPVRFGAAVDRLVAEGFRHFVEIGPHPMLTGAIRSAFEAAGVDGTAVGSLRREEGMVRRLWSSLAELHCRGAAVDWPRVLPRGRIIPLPTYPFQRQRYWLEVSGAPRARPADTGGHPLIGPAFRMSAGAEVFHERELSAQRVPWLGDHAVAAATVLPAAASVEMLRAAVGGGLASVTFAEPVLVPRDGGVRVQVAVRDGQATLAQAVGDGWEVRVRAKARPVTLEDRPLVRAGLEELDPGALSEGLLTQGLRHGPAFRGIVGLWAEAGRAVGRVELPPAAGPSSGYGCIRRCWTRVCRWRRRRGRSTGRGCPRPSRRSP